MKKFGLLIMVLLSGSASAQVINDYRSNVASGTWATVGTWQRYNGTTWVAATTVPTNATANVISILNGHVITIGANTTIDQTIVDAGGILTWSAGTLTVANGVGVDLSVFGEFRDYRTTSVTMTGTWTLNSTGTFRKNAGGSSNIWQNGYDGGISTISANTNWILDRNTANQPVISTVPSGGAFYGNLTIQNSQAGIWDPVSSASWFTGAGNFPTVKGNFDIGGAGSSTVAFTNNNTNASNLIVKGNMIVRAGSSYKNYGTGTTIEGNLTVNGSIIYDANDARNITFTGILPQSVNGAGTLNVYTLTMAKTSDSLVLNRVVTVDNLATFTSGKIISTTTNALKFAINATCSGMSDLSFTSGPVHYLGISAFTYPIGKGSKYCPSSTGLGSGGGNTIIWSENFTSGASTWSLANVMGAEGADPNFFNVSSDEGGNITPDLGSPASCGTGNADNTMHITSIFNPTGGAAYDAGGLCGFFNCPLTNREARTPNINCTGQTNIKLKFNYIEGGATTLDNASVFYSPDAGTTWSLLDDMPKTLTACGGQGVWISRTLSLPASSDNNSLVQLAFRWVNNDDGAGTDPSFAIDNIEVFVSSPPNEFRAEYFRGNPVTTFGTPLEPTINFIETCEYWLIDRLQGSNARTVTLFGTTNSCAQPGVCNGVARWSGAIWEDKGLGNSPCATIGGITPVQSAGTIVSFSPFTIISVIVPLPITLLDFTAKKGKSESVNCSWTTASESNNDYFEVQHSSDGINFATFDKVKSAGNSTTILNYNATHRNPIQGNNYYRLRQLDFDGKSSLSELRIVDFDANSLSLFPNPALDQVFFSDKIDLVAYKIYSAEGKLVEFKTLDQNTKEGSIDLSQLQYGVFTIRFETISGEVKLTKLVKQ